MIQNDNSYKTLSLCSPGGEGEDEMRRVEEELEWRAKEPRMLQRLQQPNQQQPGQHQLYPYKRVPPPPPSAAATIGRRRREGRPETRAEAAARH